MDIADIFTSWLAHNAARIEGRFEVERIGDWSHKPPQHGIALDLSGDDATGRVTAWPRQAANADWPFADIEILDNATEEIVLAETFVEFNSSLLDRWLAALEAHTDSG